MENFIIIFLEVKKMESRLKELREDNDLTQEECAKIAIISKNSYIRYEKGEREIPLDVAVAFAKHYNTSIDYIAKLTDEIKPYKSAKYIQNNYKCNINNF